LRFFIYCRGFTRKVHGPPPPQRIPDAWLRKRFEGGGGVWGGGGGVKNIRNNKNVFHVWPIRVDAWGGGGWGVGGGGGGGGRGAMNWQNRDLRDLGFPRFSSSAMELLGAAPERVLHAQPPDPAAQLNRNSGPALREGGGGGVGGGGGGGVRGGRTRLPSPIKREPTDFARRSTVFGWDDR